MTKAWILVALFFILGIGTWVWQEHKAKAAEMHDNEEATTHRPMSDGIDLAPLTESVGEKSDDSPKNVSDQEVPPTSDYAAKLMEVKIPERTASEYIEYPGFVMSFNEKAHQPNWVAWELTGDKVKTNVVGKRKNNFAEDPKVKGCATLNDYRASGYDRGHMAPAGDMKWSAAASDACFLLTNMSPQRNSLNSGAWRILEEKCRSWAIRDSAVIIVCGPILTDRIKNKIGDTGVKVPERYFKVVLEPFANPPRGIGFIMPNTTVNGGIQTAAVSIDEVERVTGFDFFSALDDEVEMTVESECNFARWNRK